MTITTYPSNIATAGTIYFAVALVDANGELYTVDPFADPAVVMRRNGAAFTPTSVTVTQRGVTQVYDVAIVYTGLTAGDYITIEPSVELVDGQVIQLPSGAMRAASSASVDLSPITDVLGTPAGASMSADIAAVNAEVSKVPRSSTTLVAGRFQRTNHDNSDETIEETYGAPA